MSEADAVPEAREPADPVPSEQLLAQFQAGDADALERLWARYLPRLKRWAHARLPACGRSLADTEDLVQDAFVRSLAHLKTFAPRGPHTLAAYVMRTIRNQIYDTLRRVKRGPGFDELDTEAHVDDGPSPLEQLVGREAVERYEAALLRLSEDDQALLRFHLELGSNDAELVELLDKPSVAAARMARGRALARLARHMEALAAEGVHVRNRTR
jgi:RNA polymerase sigma-70 factor (ECF subfamily)